MPFCNPPKNPIFFITVFPNQGFICFSPSYVGSFRFFLVVLVRVSQRKQESKKFLLPYFFSSPLYYFLPSLSLLLLSFLSFYYFLPLLFITHFLVSPTRSLSPFNSSFLGSLWKSLSDLMKKMKGVVPVEPSSYALYQDSRAKFKHHSLMQDYEELQKDAEAMKNRLEMMKQKKSILTAEVRFLRRRYKYLIGKQSMNPKPKQDLVQTHNLKVQRNNVSKGKNYSKKESALRYPAPAMDLNQRQRINSAINVTLSTPNSDLNHKARNVNWKDTTLHNSNPVIGLNQKERIQSGKESVKTKNTPVFDLNQVSLEEEEEIQANCEPLRTDEPNKSILRGGIDEQHNDMKLLVCRTIRNGSNRSGKRKITWQDQVALRV